MGKSTTATQALAPEEIRRNPPLLLSEREVSLYLGLSPRSVRNLRKRRLIPYIKLGGRVLFRLAEIDRALAKLEVRSV